MTDQHAPDPLFGEDAVPPPAFEPADTLPATRVRSVEPAAESGTFGASGQPVRGRSRARWLLALVGVLVVAVGTYLIVSLAGARPAASSAIGWMPATTTSYAEVRLDLPGDQRQKLAAFLSVFPGFKDQSQIEPKLNDVLDRIVRAASKDSQTWTADIEPWFGGQLAIGSGSAAGSGVAVPVVVGGDIPLVVATVKDRTKAIDWLTRTVTTLTNRSTYGGAELFVGASESEGAVAITDTAMIAGLVPAVKAAVDAKGAATLAQNDDMKAALATVDKDYVVLGVVRTRAQFEALTKTMGASASDALAGTQMDETVLGMIPAWTAMTARFENDAIVATSAGPSWAIGVDTANRASQLLGHLPAKTIAYFEAHDLGPTLQTLVAKFRALPETKPAFDQADQVLNLIGGLDAVIGWWGDSAVVIAPAGDGTIGGGLVIKPRDAAAADRLFTTLNGFLALGGGTIGVTTRSEDHLGTKVTILDISNAEGLDPDSLPPGYKAEIAWATNADVTVIGYGATFVKDVLSAGPGTSLADDVRFKALLGRVGADNISSGYVDIAGIRTLLEPLMERMAPPAEWTSYVTEIKPYLDHLDAAIQAVRKDQGLDLGSGFITVR
ncbi:MAG: DUF3352 domain-containing protein [Chloroflexota bacterium]|nr:DUF3352 domain-containing protein [Chloroflexota bacterium]